MTSDIKQFSEIKPESEMTSQDYYYKPKSHFAVQQGLLQDQIRTLSYKEAIFSNKHLFRGKVVLEVGCGTGILSMFAAEAGAARVIGVENTSLAEHAEHIVMDNGLADIVTIVQGEVSDMQLPDGLKSVDIILSEWMGDCLFHDSSLESVLLARDRWLVKGGLMFPDRATLYVAAIEDRRYKAAHYDWWEYVHGFNMEPIKEVSLRQPLVAMVSKEAVVTNQCLIKEFNIQTGTIEDISFESVFCLSVKRSEYIQALVTFFNVDFSICPKRVSISTSPASPPTHWKQTTFYLREELTVKKGEQLTGTFKVGHNKNQRTKIDVEIEVNFNGKLCKVDEISMYRMQ